MSKIFTGNVFVTTSETVMNTFFSRRTVSDGFDKLNARQKDLSILAGPGRNDSLQSFSYSFGVAGGGDQKMLILRFLETGKLFEKFYLESNLNNETIKSSLGGIYQKRIYISFGVGNNLKAWAGPFVLSLIDASYTLNEFGLRQITLKFVPISGPLLRNQYIDSAAIANLNKIKKGSVNLDFRQAISDKITIPYSQRFDSEIVDDTIVKILKSYIKKITSNSEVLVLLPKIGSILKKYVDSDLLGNNRQDLTTFFNRVGLESEIQQTAPPPLITRPETYLEQNPVSNNPNNVNLFIRSQQPRQPYDQSTQPDYYEPLRKFDDAIYILLREHGRLYEPYFIIEDNISVLNLWKEFGWIENSSKCVFVFGDKKLISTLLYLENITSKSEVGTYTYSNPVDLNKETEKYKNVNYANKYAEEIIKSRSSLELDIGDNLSLDGKTSRDNLIVDFRYGIKDPNILSLNFNSMPGYISLFNQTYTRASILQSINNKENLLKDFIRKTFDAVKIVYNFLFPQDVVTQRESAAQSRRELKNIPGQPGQTELSGDQQSSVNSVGASNRARSSNSPVIQTKDQNQFLVSEKQLLETLKLSFIKISIRTVPFFHISSLTSLGRKCKITSQMPSIIGSKEGIKNSFLDGNYAIIGFNHVMTPSEMYSEFTLIKQLDSISSEINPETGDVKSPGEVIEQSTTTTNSGTRVVISSSSGGLRDWASESGPAISPAVEELNCGPAG